MLPYKTFLLSSALLGFTAVGIGAFAAHYLKTRLSTEMAAVFEVGVRYHMYHALALLGLGLMFQLGQPKEFVWAGYCFISGICLFSGSLYALALTGTRILGAITPLGGVLLLLGWAYMAWGLKSL
ncbi:MAG: hypothetical protein CMO81_12550 [Waddliaceae bacterium]|nr:hypothetical protein [Waddliaceae bacterium]